LNSIASEDQVIQQLVHWAERQPLVCAVILTSSRAIPHAHTDAFSDYDVILVLREIKSFYDDRSWLETFGSVLALYRDPLINDRGLERSAYVTQYETGLKIDFSLWPVELLERVASEPALTPEFDAGYQVLLDKTNLTEGLNPPTYSSYIPKPPTDIQYHRDHLGIVQNNSGTSTISTAVTSGSAESVSLAVSGVPSGATAGLSPASVTAGGSSTLTVNAGTAAAGTYTLTVTGTAASATHAWLSVLKSVAVPPAFAQ